MKEKHNKNNNMTSSTKKYTHYQDSSNKYSEFYKRKLREKMNNLFNGSAEDKLKALNLAEELADKSTLPILRRGLKDINPQIVELSASLIAKFK
ncbi:annexin [Prochlorococcus sp. AH-716-K03]|nr:annexin [Prochlorococcus sp. AH-716-K03]